MVTKLATLVDLRDKIIPIALWVKRTRSNYWSAFQHCPLKIDWIIYLIMTKHGTNVISGELIIHGTCIYATLLNFARGGGGVDFCFSYISCFVFSNSFFSVIYIIRGGCSFVDTGYTRIQQNKSRQFFFLIYFICAPDSKQHVDDLSEHFLTLYEILTTIPSSVQLAT